MGRIFNPRPIYISFRKVLNGHSNKLRRLILFFNGIFSFEFLRRF
ncbi:hypothetical protein LEP1GSC050_0082 [Leptospira phage vB_LbrZ_5399-LE1]|nr:hypothetical protein LEP1GSC050_0082 [Leptospira phage vB_LbrZ_5399-LE1]